MAPRGALTVRSARIEDHRALVALWGDVDRLHAGLVPGFFTDGKEAGALTLHGLHRALSGSGRAVLVAERGAELCGCARLEIYDTPAHPGMRARRRAHVERIVVAAAHRRSGVGRRLMEEAAAWATARGATQVILTVWFGNEAAESFYRALGYTTVSRVLGRDLP